MTGRSRRFGLKVLKEERELFPHLGPAGQSAPMRFDQTDQPIAFVNRYAMVVTGAVHPVDEERLDVGFEDIQHGIFVDKYLPGVSGNERLSAAGGTRVDAQHLLVWRTIKEESETDWDSESLPLKVRHLEIIEQFDPAGDTPIFSRCRVGEQDRACIARTDKLSIGGLEQVLMLVRQRRSA
jgi:hypothetical protein